MCDFAADAEAARQLLVGRVLTVERALHHRERFRPGAPHGQHRWNESLHPRLAGVRHQGR
jgi:hypothetical protein